MIHIRQVNPQGSRVFMGVLTDGVALHDALQQTAVSLNIHTATFELLGGLHEVQFTAYDFETQRRLEPIFIQRPMEIVSGHGTISQLDDTLHIHTHLTISFRDSAAQYGMVVLGGHVAAARCFAVEFTLTSYDGAPVHRAEHTGSGLKLWALPPLHTEED